MKCEVSLYVTLNAAPYVTNISSALVSSSKWMLHNLAIIFLKKDHVISVTW